MADAEKALVSQAFARAFVQTIGALFGFLMRATPGPDDPIEHYVVPAGSTDAQRVDAMTATTNARDGPGD